MSLSRITKNMRTLLSEPAMIPQYLRWMGSRLLGRHGPSVWCNPRCRMATWTDFSDFWWGRRLSLLDEADKKLMTTALTQNQGKRTVAVDIGANLGLFSFNMLDLGFSEIHAFEPDPQTFTRLVNNIRLNGVPGRIQLNCMAVGNQFSLATFNCTGGAGTHHIDPQASHTNQPQTQSIHVATISLDDYCQQFKIEYIDFLKIDVEGYEPWVLRGMKGLLTQRRIRMFIIEISADNLKNAGTSVEELFGLMTEYGYPPHEILESGTIGRQLTAADLAAVDDTEFRFMNVVCAPPR